jgi:hypothetical protein
MMPEDVTLPGTRVGFRIGDIVIGYCRPGLCHLGL